MLTADIKQKIDSARNILVGKIPTPTGQVEQITLALVYKFMNDIDEQNKELGGKLKFFTGDYSKYAWTNLLDKSLSAYERVTVYGEGLEKMHLNPNLPQFFRNVFRGAFLPFRDPEVLTIFLRQIDEFKYGVNGDLGDAFEYLLQIMGTQGDAGQFLTPRHWINFIVDVVDPQKTDKTLDPADGTAGFIISTYLHILKQNTKAGSDVPGSALTYNEKKKLSENLVGYDISHDMVRLSLVNLYLHGFADPRIYEYDTLGNVDRWDDDFDCIVTNPPFMTPRGGVKPHKKFSIQAKRSEVLFVDYIMEHLNPNGKAGIIVPEGIIFKSDTAYKALRKMMIDQIFLYAVVSLPAGIFQPYSGVKTYILLMDRVLAKKTKDILFVKVENDGFDLGAQRRPIDKNDLPKATEILKRYKMSIQTGKPFELSDEDKKIASLIPIEKISKSGDYNLSGDRYKETKALVNQKWPMVELGDVLDYEQPTNYIVKSVNYNDTYSTPVLTAGKSFILGYTDEKEGIFHDGLPVIIFDDFTTATKFVDFPFKVKSSAMKILHPKKDKVIIRYAFLTMQNIKFTFSEHKRFWISEYSKIKIPLPPLEVQQEIVSQLDIYQKIIDGAKQVVDNYKPEIKIDPDWKMVELGEISHFKRGPFGGSLKKEIFVPYGYKVYEQKHAIKNNFEIGNYYIDEQKYKEMIDFAIQPDDIIISCSGTMGRIAIVPPNVKPGIINQALLKLCPKIDVVSPVYLKITLESDSIQNKYFKDTFGSAIQNVSSVSNLKKINIPLPPLDIQKQIVFRIEEEQQLVDANKKLIELYQGKIKEKIDEVWGE